MPFLSAATSGLGLLVIALFTFLLDHEVRAGTLTRNGIFGLRTRATKRSEVSWRAGHQAAEPLLRVTGPVAVVAAALPLVVTLVARHWHPETAEAAALVAMGVGYLTVVALLVAAGVTADRAARRSEPPRGVGD